MHLPRLIAELACRAHSARERAVVAALSAGWRLVDAAAGPSPQGLQLQRREAAAETVLALHAEAIRSLPWHLPAVVLWELPRLAGVWSWRQACLALVRGGAGAGATASAAGGGCWLPTWLVMEAARRTPLPAPALPQRWALSARYPLPLRQSLVSRLAEDRQLAAQLLAVTAQAPGRELADARLPREFLAPRRALPDRARLQRLAACAPQAGLRALLGGGPTPLHGPWCELVAALPAGAAAAVRAPGWDGRLAGVALRRRGAGVATAGGWLARASAALGWRCPGMPLVATLPAERALLEACGGRLLTAREGGGQLLPTALGGWLLGLLPGIPAGPWQQDDGAGCRYAHDQDGPGGLDIRKTRRD